MSRRVEVTGAVSTRKMCGEWRVMALRRDRDPYGHELASCSSAGRHGVVPPGSSHVQAFRACLGRGVIGAE